VAPTVAERAVASAFEGTDEVQMIENFLERKFRNVDLAQHLRDDRRLQAAYRRLRYAGFSSGASIRVLKRYAERAGDLEEVGEWPDPGRE
jgi:hypothetical protein